MRTLFLFVDGLGVGSHDPKINPCASPDIRYFSSSSPRSRLLSVPGGGVRAAADAVLGVPGLPQSATGQASLFTGINAARLAGRHVPAFPNRCLRRLLRRASVLGQVTRCGKQAAFLNAYRPLFFQLPEARRWKLSATTVAALAAGLPFFTFDDLRSGVCLYHDITNETLHRQMPDLPLRSPGQAAAILLRALDRFDFVLFEYFLTDRAGHDRDMEAARQRIRLLEDLTGILVRDLDHADTLLIVASDHGNVEDLSTRQHTRNPAGIWLWGHDCASVASGLRSITDLIPAIRYRWRVQSNGNQENEADHSAA